MPARRRPNTPSCAAPTASRAAASARGGNGISRLPGLAVSSLLGLAAAGCTADTTRRPPMEVDAGPSGGDLLPPPELDAVVERTPLDTLTIRGRTQGTRIASKTPLATQITPTLPGGSFCQDIPIAETEDNRIEVYAVGGDGRLSGATVLTVAFDPEAPQPSAGTCDGTAPDQAGCRAEELCEGDGDEEDDDCDGWAGTCDLACQPCDDDAYEPNDVAINVPSLLAGSYELTLCSCRDDWFAFHVAGGARIQATVESQAQLDIDLALYQVVADVEGTGPRVAWSTASTGVEAIDYVVPLDAGGTYYLRVYPFNTAARPRGAYRLTVP